METASAFLYLLLILHQDQWFFLVDLVRWKLVLYLVWITIEIIHIFGMIGDDYDY